MGVEQCVKIERVRCDDADAYEEWLREKIYLQEKLRRREGDVTTEVRHKLMLRRQYQDSEVEHCFDCCGASQHVQKYVEFQRAQRPICPASSSATPDGWSESTSLLGSGPRKSPSSA